MIKSESIKELAIAFAKAQAEMGKAKKTSVNPAFKGSKYADLEEIIDTLKGVLPKYDLSYIQMPGVAGSLTTMLMHVSGEFIGETATTPLRKQDPQGVGDAITYLRRYSLAAFAGIAQQDDDGNSHGNPKAPAKPPVKAPIAPQNAAPVVFKYDLKGMRDDKKEAAEQFLQEQDAVWDEEDLCWESKVPLKPLEKWLKK